MEQLIQQSDSQPSVNGLQQQTETGSFSIAQFPSDFGLTKSIRRQLRKNEVSATTKHKSVLPDLHEGEVKKLLGAMKSEEALLRSREELRQISKQLLTIQENERQRIAADLHDGIGQSLSLIKLSLESVMQQVVTGERREAVRSLQQLSHKVKETMAELHRTTMDMRPAMLDDLGIIPTLSWFFREFESAWHDRKVEKDVSIAESDVPVPLKATIFRILQEAMNNIVKHARADSIHVSLKRTGDILQLSIADNGRGFDLSAASARRGSDRGFGLFTMKERARSSGGSFEMQSALESGTRILVSWRFANHTDGEFSDRSGRARNLSNV
ncbi:signal transduction histidine-protein kinase/phosphatase DegS [mine drainage metagenome]|uniref:histidine kinase n=1 Tax=mine drainage metagenome TaxID=410659 RepID=A0A1J5T619_9ZZZZ